MVIFGSHNLVQNAPKRTKNAPKRTKTHQNAPKRTQNAPNCTISKKFYGGHAPEPPSKAWRYTSRKQDVYFSPLLSPPMFEH